MAASRTGAAFRRLFAGLALLVPLVVVPSSAAADQRPAPAVTPPGSTYVNPVSQGFADTFADPDVVRGKDGYWYAFGTSDPLREGGGEHSLPVARSRDLVHWSYVEDALSGKSEPEWAAKGAAYWAPDVSYHDGRYWLYFVVTQTDVTKEKDDSAIGVATALSPTGPWKTHGEPVVPPRRAGGGQKGFKWTFDPAHVVDSDGRRHLYYGSYNGGIDVAALSGDGTRRTGRPVKVATDNRFEGAYVLRRGGWWYLFASSGDCCAGPTTGYSLFVGRSRSVRGPFKDREGVPLTASRTGGTVALTPNGNRWVGTGHNSVVKDLAGQDWIVYHAIDRSEPYLDEPYGINRRPMLIDRLDWPGGWPTVRGGKGASAGRQPAPVTSPDAGRGSGAGVRTADGGLPGLLDPSYSDEFARGASDSGRGWQWVRKPAGHTEGGRYVWPTQDAELHKDENTASVMLREVPRGGFTAETKLSIDLGVQSERNYQQAGLVAYAGDDEYLRLAHTAIWNTRQTEYGKERPYAGDISYGSTSVGPPARTTWLRLRHTTAPGGGEHRVKAFTSRDGEKWIAGGTWTVPASKKLRFGLVSMGGKGATARFGYFRLYRH